MFVRALDGDEIMIITSIEENGSKRVRALHEHEIMLL